MKLIVGLGNPGKQYENTRHNAGFLMLDHFLKEQGSAEIFKFEKKFEAEMVQISVLDKKVLLMKPMTYMNLSGKAVKSVTDYFKIGREDLMVVHDDMDIPLGEIRLRNTGRSGGHNGLQSIIDEVGTEDVARMKLGIGRPEREATQHVLEKFTEDESKLFDKVLEKGNQVIGDFIRLDKLDNTSNSVI